jgi:hypothetical protein
MRTFTSEEEFMELFWCSWLRLYSVLFVFVGSIVLSLPLSAQTLFSWSAKDPDVAKLTTVDECLGAVGRVFDSTQNRSSIWIDTLPYSKEEALKKHPGRVTETAKRCSFRFVANAVPPQEFVSMLRLFLYANRDSDVDSLIAYRIAVIPSNGDTTSNPVLTADSIRIAILDTAIFEMLGAVPARINLAIPYVEQFLASSGASMVSRVNLAFRIGQLAELRGDTELSRQWYQRGIEISSKGTVSEKQQIIGTVFLVLQKLYRDGLVDSLRLETDAYKRYMERLWNSAMGEENAQLPLPIGFQTRPLDANYWFEYNDKSKEKISPSGSTHKVCPVPGQINLILVLSPEPDIIPGSYSGIGYVLKRLKERFPELAITVMTYTLGYVYPIEPPTSEQEAEIYRKRFFDHLQWPVTLGVIEIPWWRLDAPDRRRINEIVFLLKWMESLVGPSQTNYGNAFLIDPNGKLVTIGLLFRYLEDDWESLIQALVQQKLNSSK